MTQILPVVLNKPVKVCVMYFKQTNNHMSNSVINYPQLKN